MTKRKFILREIACPPVWFVVFMTLFSAVLLGVVFVKGWNFSVVAYFIYPLSAYALLILCIALGKAFPKYYQSIKRKMHQYKYVDRYMSDIVFKSNVGLYRALIINVIYAIVNGMAAYVFETYWFGVFAVYYAIIAMIRLMLVLYLKKNKVGENYRGELKRARFCACLLITVNLALTGAVLMMILFDKGFYYRGFLIYLIALYTFYITIAAMRDIVTYHKYKSPVMTVTKIIKMTSALFSMLFLETAMFAQFGTETSVQVKHSMIMATGAGICIIVVVMSLYIIIKTTKEMRKGND